MESSPLDLFEASSTSSLNEASASPPPTSLTERRGVDLASGVDLAIGGVVVVAVFAVFAGGVDDGAVVVSERGEIL